MVEFISSDGYSTDIRVLTRDFNIRIHFYESDTIGSAFCNKNLEKTLISEINSYRKEKHEEFLEWAKDKNDVDINDYPVRPMVESIDCI